MRIRAILLAAVLGACAGGADGGSATDTSDGAVTDWTGVAGTAEQPRGSATSPAGGAALVVAPLERPSVGAEPARLVGHGREIVSVRSFPDQNRVELSHSADGLTWRPIATELDAGWVQALASDGRRLLLAGTGGPPPGDLAAWISNDGGVTWTRSPLPTTTDELPEHVALVVAVEGAAMTADTAVLFGRVATQVDWAAYALDELGEDHGDVVGEGGDTASWTLTFADGFQMTVDLGTLGLDASSPIGTLTTWTLEDDGWQQRDPPFARAAVGALDNAVVAGPAGFLTVMPAPLSTDPAAVPFDVYVSPDGATWQSSPAPAAVGRGIQGPATAGGPLGYVLVGSDVVLHSLDGVTWSEVDRFEDLNPGPSACTLPCTGFPGGMAGFAVSIADVLDETTDDSGVETRHVVQALWSPDGTSWDQAPLPEGATSAAVAVSDTTVLVVPRADPST
jgi:hypothetical protein